MVITFTIINDFFYPEQARSVVSYTILAYAFMPAVAIALGGYITTHLSWVDCFYFFVIYGVFILCVMAFLPETLANKKMDALKLRPLLQSYRHAFGSWRLVFFSLIYGLMAAFIYIVASGAPFIGIDFLKLTPATYGYFILLAYAGQCVGAVVSGKLNKRLPPYKVMGIGYVCVIIGSLLMFFTFLAGWINVFTLVLPLSVLMMGMPMIYSTVAVMALMQFEDKASGSAVMSCITMSIALLGTFVLTQLPTRYPITMPSSFVVILVIAVLAFLYALKHFCTNPEAQQPRQPTRVIEP